MDPKFNTKDRTNFGTNSGDGKKPIRRYIYFSKPSASKGSSDNGILTSIEPKQPTSPYYSVAETFFNKTKQKNEDGSTVVNKTMMSKAIENYEQALVDEPKNYFILGKLGFCYLLLGENSTSMDENLKSMDYYKQAVDLFPDDSHGQAFYNDMGRLSKRMGNLEDAISYFSRSIELVEQTQKNDSKSTFSYNNRALLYQKLAKEKAAQKDIEGAKSDYKNALSDISNAILIEGEGRKFYEEYQNTYMKILIEYEKLSRASSQ